MTDKLFDFLKTLATDETELKTYPDIRCTPTFKPISSEDAEKLEQMLNEQLTALNEKTGKQLEHTEAKAKSAEKDARFSKAVSIVSIVIAVLSLLVAIISTIFAAIAVGYFPPKM